MGVQTTAVVTINSNQIPKQEVTTYVATPHPVCPDPFKNGSTR